ncbi:MAG: Ig domain-containing protein [Bacilli bacterium]
MNKFLTRLASVSLSVALVFGTGLVINSALNKDFVSALAESTSIMTFDFEDTTAHRTSGSNSYTGTNEYAENNVKINLTYADSVTTGSPLTGTANILGRVTKNTTNSPTVVIGPMNLSSYNVEGFSYRAKGPTTLSFTASYSTDGASWTDAETHVSTTTSTVYSSSAISVLNPSDFYVKIVAFITNGSSTTSNRDVQIDDVIILGTSTSTAVLESISCDDQSISVTESLDFNNLISFSPEDAPNKNVSFTIKSGEEYVDFNSSTGVLTGKKSGQTVVTITPEDTNASSIDVTVTINAIESGINIGDQYVLYAVDETNSLNYEMIGISSNIGTAETFDGSVPSCSYVLDTEEGYYENSVAFKNNNNYLSLTSENNNLYTSTTITLNSSWIVTWNSETHEATIYNCAYKNRCIQFNKSSPRFACYTGLQTGICLYPYEAKELNDFSIETEIEVYKTATRQIEVTFDPNDAADKTLTWSVTASNPEGCVTVDDDGVVTGAELGTATISASKVIGGSTVTRTCEVTVLSNSSNHTGLVDDPFDVNDAVNFTKGIFVTDVNGDALNLENTYYVTGLITSVITRTTSTLSFWIGDDASQTDATTGGFEVYKTASVYDTALATYYTDNTEVTRDFNVGYRVTVSATFTLYNNIAETSSGTANVVWNNYIEAREYGETFLDFLSTGTDAICDSEGNTSLENLVDAWGLLAEEYFTLTDDAKSIYETSTANSTGTDVQKTLSLYQYIGEKYGHQLETEELANFDFMNMGITPRSSSSTVLLGYLNDNNNHLPLVIIASLIGLVIISTTYFVKKRKEQ